MYLIKLYITTKTYTLLGRHDIGNKSYAALIEIYRTPFNKAKMITHNSVIYITLKLLSIKSIITTLYSKDLLLYLRNFLYLK